MLVCVGRSGGTRFAGETGKGGGTVMIDGLRGLVWFGTWEVKLRLGGRAEAECFKEALIESCIDSCFTVIAMWTDCLS